jgi:hypothetical protein
MQPNPRLNVPQSQFINMPNKFRAFVAGFGSGKTWVGCAATCKHFWEFPKVNSGYFAPTYPQIRDIFYPTIEEVAHEWGLKTTVRTSDKEVHYYSGSKYRGTTICRSLDDPGSVVGFKIGHALVDEFDLLPIDKALLAHRKILARMRYKVDGLKNGVDITTTPEGFKATYQLFVEEVIKKPEKAVNYGLIHASTYQNEANLPEDYIPSLLEAYPEQLITAYLNGQFVNLTSGTVYRNYDRHRCNSSEVVIDREPLRLGMDFNVEHMAATVYVMRGKVWHAVDEFSDYLDTPDICRAIKERYPENKIVVYPDASGKNRKTTGAAESDIKILKNNGFTVRAHDSNPLVKDRVNATNKAFSDCLIKVNYRKAPTVAKCLEQQAYDKNGEPDKKSGQDHQNDATTYPIVYELPIVRPHGTPVPMRRF